MAQAENKKSGIRKQILISFVILNVIALGVIAVTAIIFNSLIGNSITGAPDEVLDLVRDNIQTQFAIIIITLWEIIVISLFVGLKLADSVVKPIQKLTNIALKLCTHDLKTVSFQEIATDFDKEIETQETELGNLTEAFKKLVNRVKDDVK
ncbi:MAG: hypothetical protein ACW98D_06405 [Promethearchaeota archaeon]|jgi:hypothetical protein